MLKKGHQPSIQDHIELENVKSDNQIAVSKAKEFAKIDAREESKFRDMERRATSFQRNKDNYRFNSGNSWEMTVSKMQCILEFALPIITFIFCLPEPRQVWSTKG